MLVSGATSGIGESTSRALVGVGASVALMARSVDRVEALAAELGTSAIAVAGDVTDADGMVRAVDAAAGRLGGLDAVVCSAGVVRPGPLSDTAPDDWRAMFEVNVLGVLHVVNAALPHLRQAPIADVVNLSSMSGRRRASVALGLYSASKFAVHALSDSLREELAPDGVRVSIISPGYVRTPIFDEVSDPAERSRLRSELESKGLPPDVVAAQVLHVLSQPVGVDVLEVALLSTNQ